MMRSGTPTQRARSGRSAGGSAAGSISTSIMMFLSCLGTVYVGGRLWQDSRLQQQLMEARKVLQAKPQSKALSVEDSIMKIEFAELQKREAMLQVELVEAKARGYIPIAAGSPLVNSTTASGSLGSFWDSSTHASSAKNASALSRRVQPIVNRYIAVVGITSRFPDRALRDAIRASWLPNGEQALKRLAEEQGIVLRFIIGHSPNRGDSSDRAIKEESAAHKDFMILDDHEEDDHNGAGKLKSFYARAVRLWDAAFYVKMEDDVYLNIPGLIATLKTYKSKPRVYMGCMKSTEVVVDSNSRWFEPEHARFGDGKMYMRHTAGPIYIVSKEIAVYFAIARDLLHEYKHEDVSVGSWMLGLNVDYEDNRLLCCASAPEDECVKKREAHTPCAAVYDWHCGGLCEAEKRISQVHKTCYGDGSSQVK